MKNVWNIWSTFYRRNFDKFFFILPTSLEPVYKICSKMCFLNSHLKYYRNCHPGVFLTHFCPALHFIYKPVICFALQIKLLKCNTGLKWVWSNWYEKSHKILRKALLSRAFFVKLQNYSLRKISPVCFFSFRRNFSEQQASRRTLGNCFNSVLVLVEQPKQILLLWFMVNLLETGNGIQSLSLWYNQRNGN